MITVFCPRCGHENANDNRYCGMCGTTLLEPGLGPIASRAGRTDPEQIRTPDPPPISSSAPADETPISGPSFLGLGAEDGSGAEYLFGEDRSSGHWRLYLALAVLAFTGALLWMQWRHGAINSGYVSGLVKRVQERLETNTASSSSPQTTSPAPAPPPSNQASGPVASNTAPPASAPAPTQPSAQGGHQPQEKDLPPQGSAEAGSKSQASDKADDDGSDAGEGKHSNGTVSEAKLRTPKAPTAASEPRDTGSDMLLATAQKYLYGQGVPQDCDRAVSYLRQAAEGASAKAKSQLGVLYATGHCVPVDRPTAYRWFSRALRQEQNNQYVSHDLQMLWNQMTSEEKQLALRMNR